MRLPFITTVCLTLVQAPAHADKIIPPANLFRDPGFVRQFVGSYGFLSDVEPRVSAEEQALLSRVRELFEQNQFITAEQEIVRFIQETEAPTDPKKQPAEISAAMVFVLGNLYFSADRPDEARRAFVEAIRRFPRFRRAHTNLGYLHVSTNQFDEAATALQKAIELGETSPRTYGLLGYCYLNQKKLIAAENAYRQAYLLDPVNRDWKIGIAQTLMQQEKLQEAASMFDTLIAENPDDRQLWLQQANAYLGQDRKAEAAVNLEVLKLKGQASESELTLLGNIYMELREAQLALFAYLGALEKAPKLDVQKALKSARILNDYGYPEKAGEFVAKISQKGELSEQDQFDLDLVRVKIAQAANETEQVGSLLTGLFRRNPANAEVLLELARHYDHLAKNEADETKRIAAEGEAKVHFKLALEKESVAYAANLGLGQLLVRTKQYSDAIPYIEKALSLKTGDKSGLEQYLSRVRRAADRELLRKDREAVERAEADKKSSKN